MHAKEPLRGGSVSDSTPPTDRPKTARPQARRGSKIALAGWLFHRVTVKDYAWDPDSGSRSAEWHLASARRYLGRFGGSLSVAGKTALDVGCGTGHLCIELARLGAEHVVGAEMQDLTYAHRNLSAEPPEVKERVEFVHSDGKLPDQGGRRFDLVFSKDSFEHYAEPEAIVEQMTEVLTDRGELVIGFGPLWKGPTGGHINYMTKLPWAHLLFPESVIMAERRRFRPHEHAEHFEEIVGGLNKMTLARFESIMAATGLRCRYFHTNVSDNPVVKAMAVISRVPPLREYFTASVHSIWEKDAGAPAPSEARRGS